MCFPKARVKKEDVPKALPLLPKEGFMSAFDLKSGYHRVHIQSDFTQFLGFQWRGSLFKFLVLPFGMSLAPFVFTELLKPLMKKWRTDGLGVAMYLDDGLIWSYTAHRCEESTRIIRADLGEAGFAMSEAKCIWVPTQKIT